MVANKKTPEYSAINPFKQVPTLVIDGQTLTQSLAIIEYLDESRPQPPRLLPSDPMKRAKVRELSLIVASGIQPAQNLTLLQRVANLVPENKDIKTQWAHHSINEGLFALEKETSQSAGKYSVGDEVTMADLCLVPQLYNARRFNVDLSPFPTLLRVESALINLPEFVASHPDKQPDVNS